MDGTIGVFKVEEIFDETNVEAVKSSLEQEHKDFHKLAFEAQVKDEKLPMETDDSSSHQPKKEATVRQKFRRYRHKEYQCDECDRMFTLKHNLQNHFVQYHMGCRTLHKASASCTCTICGKIYSAASVLAEHMINEHEASVKLEECRICQEKFFTMAALMKHIRVHNRVWKLCPHEGCEDLKFKFVKEINEHIRLKHKAEGLVCSVCNMVFRQLSAKIKHEEKHDKELKDVDDDYQGRPQKAKCDEDLVKRKSHSLPPQLKHRKSFHPEIEATLIKRKTWKRLTKEEIVAKIKMT